MKRWTLFGGPAAAEGMADVWIDFQTTVNGEPAQLHGLWLPAGQPKAPILLYLRGARCNVTGSAPRMRRMQELVFMLVEGGSHHNTNHVGQAQYRQAQRGRPPQRHQRNGDLIRSDQCLPRPPPPRRLPLRSMPNPRPCHPR